MYKTHNAHVLISADAQNTQYIRTGDAEKVGNDEDLLFPSVHRQSLAWERKKNSQSLNFNSLTPNYLTGSEVVMTPAILMMLGCLNCPMMAASCRNFTLSSSVDSPSRDFTATSTPELLLEGEGLHTPRFTVPNWPLPRYSCILLY